MLQLNTKPENGAAEKGKERIFRGTGVNGLAAAGKLRFLKKTPERPLPAYRGAEAEKSAFRDAVIRARRELSRLAEQAGGEAADVLEIHGMLLTDREFTTAAEAAVDRGMTAAAAAKAAAEEMAAVFEEMEDDYLRARSADMRDVGERVSAILTGSGDRSLPLSEEEGPVILAAPELSPGETVALDKSRIAGFVTFGGSPSSHTAILARSMGIPALVRTGVIPDAYDGTDAVIDARAGTLTVDPTIGELEALSRRQEEERQRRERLRALAVLPAVTASGKKVPICANVGSVAEANTAMEQGAEGIGLFRSEFLFLGRASLPDEEEQFSAYRDAVQAVSRAKAPADGSPRLCVIRTLDVGADKTLPGLTQPTEENPALGVRGIRLTLTHPALFRTQLRAILRASAYGDAAIMLPMVVSPEEVRRAAELVRHVKNELRYAEIAFAGNVPLGIMIETPAAALMARELAAECDFFSVGTNDLCQYTYAADRQNPALNGIFAASDGYEAVFRLISLAAEGIHAAGSGKWLGVCGELAADPSLTRRFLDCGADELSVSAPYLGPVKEAVRNAR